jgi:tetratricopeptide (TPR) repeat protein
LGEHDVARKMLSESVTLAREFDSPDVLAEALMRLGRVESDVSQNEIAFQHLDEALTLARKIDNRKLIADVLYNLSVLAMGKDEYHQAIARSNESSEIFRELGDQYGEAGCINIVGYAYWCLGDYVNSERYYLSALTLARQMVNPYMVAIVLDNLGFAQIALNKDGEAQKSFQESLAGTLDTHALTITLEVIVGIATLIMRAGDQDEAMTLLQFAVNHSAATVDVKRLAQPPLNQLLKLMPPAAVEAAIQRSHSLDFDSVVAKVTKV